MGPTQRYAGPEASPALTKDANSPNVHLHRITTLPPNLIIAHAFSVPIFHLILLKLIDLFLFYILPVTIT
jgi:hypothetical protein